ncbi:hypothetical protein MF406_13005 [Georgenia sp. TF02-10]|uniref:AMIN-like domain-containing (lipo)protein n=1 Tax=Georgenia sp. TF02-10 TaxID=2917725 RepID=UPI001FA7D01A|nr:hypothetical protein [Georgenia sp. TF02-10]UNX53883.1 hypothetical protein MF406_13005 [Georgenia sp. TF02-10]
MRRLTKYLLALVLGLTFLVPAGAAQAATPYCGIHWGSLAKQAGSLSAAQLTNVRTGRHTCYDRMVVDFRGDVTGYSVQYVSQFAAEGSGAAIPLRGAADLAVTAHAPAYDASGNPTYAPANPRELRNVMGYQTFRQLAWGGSFEGSSSIGLGVRARLPFRVFVLDGPGTGSRLVVDVAHFW